ncbi:MAG: HEAT repeat domain-containing protein [Sandaracinus sp.]|nr:HEAT repeat domain-containing protein [Sandaracinus sp.]MCB9619360.1 HEAT repeat domain-containing protein [Sandaracinus sp.]MCB9633649.1 HEAT repeat domain-containing protein [Sandaracinus sp.]
MSTRFEPRIERLLHALRVGLGSEDVGDVRAELGLSAEASDRDVVRSLVQIVSAVAVTEAGRRGVSEEVAPAEEAASSAEATTPSSPLSSGAGTSTLPSLEGMSADTSLLGRVESFGRDAIPVSQLDDVETLLGLLRGGGTRQRRAVLRHLRERWDQLSNRDQRAASEELASLRDVELEAELAQTRARVGGAVGRQARTERERWLRLVSELEPRITAFWDGRTPVEPVTDMPGDDRAHLLLHARDLPPLVMTHLQAVIEGNDGVSSREVRRELLESLRYAGDPRLVPSLVELLDSGSAEIVLDAARALRRIDDPRVVPALVAAYERTVLDVAKAVFAGALAAHGDRRGADYVRDLIAREDVEVRAAALEALELLGSKEDTEKVLALLGTSASLNLQVVNTLQRLGDRRALRPLIELEAATHIGALRGAIEDARAAIVARMELRGEDYEDEETRSIRLPTDERPPRTSFGMRMRAMRMYVWGTVLVAFGALSAGIARLERAGTLRPEWARPWIAVAMTHARKARHAQALAAFRRALETDRGLVERNPLVVRALAQTFLRRAEQVERDGRHDVARGLLGEALDLDLRRAPSAVRFEIQRRRRALQRAA